VNAQIKMSPACPRTPGAGCGLRHECGGPTRVRWGTLVGMSSVYEGPVTIVRSRYGGIYEPGMWLAFPVRPDLLPSDWAADDVACMQFFEDRKGEFGGGESPQEAYKDLLIILSGRRDRPTDNN